MHYVVEHDKAERLIIHYYKTMSKRESKPIVDMLFRLGLTIPVIIVTINKTEESEIVVFDNNVPDKMPLSGTIIPIKANEFLLYNNSKYKQGDKCDYLFPVKVKIAKLISNGEKGEITNPEVTEMINLVYQLSRMYWKSVKQQNLPITIKYPEMVAEIAPNFIGSDIPDEGKNSLWFL